MCMFEKVQLNIHERESIKRQFIICSQSFTLIFMFDM